MVGHLGMFVVVVDGYSFALPCSAPLVLIRRPNEKATFQYRARTMGFSLKSHAWDSKVDHLSLTQSFWRQYLKI